MPILGEYIIVRSVALSSYLVLKFLHILASTLLFGTGLGIAFFMFMAVRSRDVRVMFVTAKHVVLADWLFTTPAVVVQFVTGVLLMQQLGFSFSSVWFLVVFSLFIFVGVCWVPVVFIQVRMKNLLAECVEVGSLSEGFLRLMRWWVGLGIPAFVCVIALFYLMVFKPLSVV